MILFLFADVTFVTLRVRVWIETAIKDSENYQRRVTLRVRVWIETDV